MQNQKLEELIQWLKQDHGQKPAATIKRLRPVLKAFNEYSTTADQLPPPTLIPICLFVLPKLFRQLLGLSEGEALEDEPQRSGVRLSLHLYLKGLLRILGESDDEIKHIVVQSMVQNIDLVNAFPQLFRKWVRALVGIWATNAQNLNLGLRCFTALERALRVGNDQFYIWALRRIYVGYFQNCGQVTWRTLQHINFMGNCFCEVIRINPPKAYYVLFGYIRTIAMQVHSLNGAKGKQKQQITSKLYSQQILQGFRLLGQAVGKSGEEELSGLTYPLAELISAYQRISESPEYITLKLHVVQIELEMMQNTGLYLPHVLECLLKILRSAPLHKKHSRKAGVEGSIELGYKLSPIQLKNTNIVNDIFDKTVFYLYWLIDLSYKTLGGVELARHISRLIQSIELGYSGHRKSIKAAARIFLKDAQKIQQARGKRKLALADKASEKFQSLLSQGKIKLESHQTYLDILQERQNLFKAKVIAEQEDNAQDKGSNGENQDEGEDQDELESGWEEASQGASEFEEEQIKEKKEEEQEDVSYSGDPEDASEAIKEWSEHQWSSQQEVQT